MSCWVAIDAGGYHPPVTHAWCVCELQSMPTNHSNCNSHLFAMDRTGAPTMPAETCTGVLRRRLPTGHPSMAGPPGHKSRPSARRHTSLPLRILPGREGKTARQAGSIGSSTRAAWFWPRRFPAVHRRLSAPLRAEQVQRIANRRWQAEKIPENGFVKCPTSRVPVRLVRRQERAGFEFGKDAARTRVLLFGQRARVEHP